ncbi:MAG: cadmium-translocating P-type ATPase [Gracilibacteraceae bacterium]|jgi:Cd2+/Zn2+-exporting ATPase|nr:cadmium-translocating P-type ATPase [Gracilibacteraceae bacterium]
MEAVIKREFMLAGLCCANCAAKIEREAGKISGVSRAALDFAGQRLTVELAAPPAADVAAQVRDIVRRHEPDIVVTEAAAGDRQPSGPAPEDENGAARRVAARLGAGGAVFAAGLALPLFVSVPPVWRLGIFLLSFLLVGGDVVLRAAKGIIGGRVFDEHFLMSIASVGAFAIGEYPEGVAVMLFYQIGEIFQARAVGSSRRSITALMAHRPDSANLQTGGGWRVAAPEEVEVGDVILVRPGEKVPLDGVVVSGSSALDVSALTGESLPRDVEEGSEALSGSVNRNGLITLRVTKPFSESTITKILDLVQNAGSKKAPVENFITKFARWYTPAVVGAAALLAVLPPLFFGAPPADWLRRALVFLVVSCPCALVISVPLSFFGGIGGASRHGILFKGGNYLDALAAAEIVAFDKTGTLTRGVFKVTDIRGSEGWPAEKILAYAARAESFSTHPIAVSIRAAYGQTPGGEAVSAYEETAGQGVRASLDGQTVLAGSAKLLAAEGIACPPVSAPGTVVYLAVDGVCAGYIVIADELREDSAETVRALKAAGIKPVVMLTGDSRAAGEDAARRLGVDRVLAELLPGQKVEEMERLSGELSPRGKTVFVGDGLNDAPVLARSDIGVAMGGAGTDAAIEAADVVLMTDKPSKLVDAIRIARQTVRIARQNIVFALGVKAVILVLGALGLASMWAAVFGDVGVTFIAVLNAMRALRS